MKTTHLHKTLAAAAAALLSTVVLAGCSDTSTSGMPGMGASSAATPAASASSTATFTDADVTFAQMMIPHHEQAVEMSDMILAKKSVDSDVTKLAQQIKAAQQPEISTMKGWLTSWGATQPSMGGMTMNGEMSEADMTNLKNADGPTGQKLYLQGMVRHHQGAIQMAQDEITKGKNPDAIALAKSIVSSQQEEITTMNGLLAKL